MAKFLNKKEQVIDFKLTSYGHYLLSIGTFKPKYYAFYDDNVLYDQRYTFANAAENQNDIDRRITEETAYIESLVLFRDTEATLNQNDGGNVDWYNQDTLLGRKTTPAKDTFKYDMSIGDAFLSEQSNYAPAWRAFALQSKISSSATTDTSTNEMIPQINIDASYVKRVIDNNYDYDPMNLREMDSKTMPFIDNKVVSLESNDPVLYIEEINTRLLTHNYEIEVFQIVSSSVSGAADTLVRKFFRKEIPQIQNGYLMSDVPKSRPESELTTGSVEYYFDVLTDTQIERAVACRGKNQLDKQSYYIDLGFDCEHDTTSADFYDIYGSATEPEICQ
tara:strand:- start:2370 stop:3371 length:1002 start_codon:yes stop_codon:yes gene_type:complete